MGGDPETLLTTVVRQYFDSGDFNGLPVPPGDDVREAVGALLEDGLIEVVGQEDFPNPHIRPWPIRRRPQEQLATVQSAASGESGTACLYPTQPALANAPEIDGFADRPFMKRVALGAGQLEVAYFRMDSLEAYRNDPRFSFVFDDFGARLSVTDAVFEDESEPDADKVSMRLGFAYRQPLGRDKPIERYVVALLRDLMRLTPEHQRRWETYEIDAAEIKPHPIWLAEAHGHWLDRIGPFDALFAELAALDELYEGAFGVPLFSTVKRPETFGWILRSSQREFDEFVQTLDKLLSDNLRHKAFDAAGIPRKADDNEPIGTLGRFDRLLERAKVSKEQREDVLKPLREVRTSRSKPAHTLRKNISDANFIRRQAELLQDVTASLEALRQFFQTHPSNQGWTPPSELLTAKRLWL